MPFLQVHASPQGRRTGLATASGGGGSVSVLVLPKLWNEGAPRYERSATGRHLSIQIHETQRLNLECSDEHAALLRLIADSAEPCSGSARGSRDGHTPDRLVRVSSETAQGVEGRAGAASPTKFLQLLTLALWARRAAGNERVSVAGSNELDSGLITRSGPSDGWPDPVVQLLHRFEYVQTVLARVREVRQGYVEMADLLHAVRGRITDRGLRDFAATRAPRIECVYDEFTDATPLYRILVSALDVVASERAGAGLSGGFDLAGEVARQAQAVRKLLATVPSVPRRQAAAAATHLRLTRLQQAWAGALLVARDILVGQPPELGSAGASHTRAHAWWIETDKLWEQILLAALQAAGADASAGNTRDRQESQPGALPWVALGHVKLPDILLANPAWILDAKYKGDWTSLTEYTPSSPDQYQIFAYSHVVEVGGAAPSGCALVLPVRADSPREPPRTKLRGGVGAVAVTAGILTPGACPLHLIGVRFPTEENLRSPQGFADCLKSLGLNLRQDIESAASPGKATL